MENKKEWSVHEALVHIQTNLNAPKNLFNKFGNYKYRNLEGIVDALKPLLKETKCNVRFTDEVVQIGERYYVSASAILEDAKGFQRVVKSLAREAETKKGMDEAQITGSASSYARKYAANGLFAIDDTKDPDTTNTHGKEPAKKTEEKPKLTKERFDKMKEALGKNAEYYTPDVKKTLSKVSATKEQIETLKGMMA